MPTAAQALGHPPSAAPASPAAGPALACFAQPCPSQAAEQTQLQGAKVEKKKATLDLDVLSLFFYPSCCLRVIVLYSPAGSWQVFVCVSGALPSV